MYLVISNVWAFPSELGTRRLGLRGVVVAGQEAVEYTGQNIEYYTPGSSALIEK